MNAPVIRITNTRPHDAPILAAMQKTIFPNLAAEEHLTEAQYRRHLEVFPEGQFVVLDDSQGERVIGSTTTLRLNFDFNGKFPSFMESIDNGWLGTHRPDGEWLYGADMMVHPDYRRRGIARQLYETRQALVRRLGLRGQVVAGMIPNYHTVADSYSIEEYITQVVAGTLTDPTLTAQLKIGMRYVKPLYNYLHDASSGNACALLIWDNPDLGR